MSAFLHSRYFYISLAIGVIAFVIFLLISIDNRNTEPLITATVEIGSVRQLVSVSGVTEADQTAELAFPTNGLVEAVNFRTGDQVEAGQIIASLNDDDLMADKLDAEANLAIAIANKEELLEGVTESTLNVIDTKVDASLESLVNVIETENQKINNAYRTLLSNDLTAISEDSREDATPPIISGTYNCQDEGDYLIDVYSSGADSGYSYRLTGIESGTFEASVNQPLPMGSCGLRIIFDDDSNYSNSEWVVSVPNKKSASYVTNRNNYVLAQTQANAAIASAERALELARAEASDQTSPPRTQSITRANANIAQAEARLARIDSNLSDRQLRAPFSGTITDIDILPGEAVTTAPALTLLAESAFEVTAKIPEIDIGLVQVGQKTEMFFDANPNQLIQGEIRFISPRATQIDGVSYYEAIISFAEVPDWIRSGLNADVDIIISQTIDTLRLPRRFVSETETGYEVLLQRNNNFASTTVEITMSGNDGFVVISGLELGDIVLAP
jgi:HlyD family secretion protein